ncbi:hypothetical protein F5Y10DRAFT_271794 [Nemania abortiva]|nr:hypothetical protein F5Y10DRAFT_271794 [Nemania abortiva]
MSDARIIIGLDFGTTYSGAVWVHSWTPDELVQIKEWPASRIDDRHKGSVKVPTQIRYLANGDFEWGAQVPEDADPGEVLRLFKLALTPDLFETAMDVFRGTKRPTNVDKNITDFMTGIFEHVCQNIRARLGADILERLPVHVVLTVPAIWREASKQRTINAFRSIPNLPRGITTSLLSEPEAAAISASRELDRSTFGNGNAFVVVDAGGGTVDLISYTVTSLLPVLRVHEASEGTGDLCGSALVDIRFQEFLTARLQNDPDWNTEVLRSARQRFENTTKRNFTLANLTVNDTFPIPVPGLARNVDVGVTRNARFSLRASDVHMFYEPYILKIIQLVKEQISRSSDPIRSIILVGGFGTSTYLRERLQDAINEDNSITTSIEILQPPNAWSAVARGAAMKGLAGARPERYDIPIVMSRTARKHYGFECGLHFDSRIHASLAERRYWDGLFGDWCVDAIKWFIKRGNRVSEGVAFLEPCSWSWPVGNGRSRTFPLTIYADEESSVAPIARTEAVKALCHLTADLGAIPDNQLDQRQGSDGRMYYHLQFDLELVYHSASTQYTLIHKGRRYATVEAEYV